MNNIVVVDMSLSIILQAFLEGYSATDGRTVLMREVVAVDPVKDVVVVRITLSDEEQKDG